MYVVSQNIKYYFEERWYIVIFFFDNKYQIELIAIGNGTASRETDQFIGEILREIKSKPIKVMVNEKDMIYRWHNITPKYIFWVPFMCHREIIKSMIKS